MRDRYTFLRNGFGPRSTHHEVRNDDNLDVPRRARLVVPQLPHHVIQRGNRRQTTFFSDADYEMYLHLLREAFGYFKVAIWCYCLMPNHVHLIAVPTVEDALAKAMARTHRRYTEQINRRNQWMGCLWQGRFRSSPMEGFHLLNAVRYILYNPVRAGLSQTPHDWIYSSVHAHVSGRPDGIVDVAPLAKSITDWNAFLREDVTEEQRERLRQHERSGHPLGSERFLVELEQRTGRALRPLTTGRPKGRTCP